MIEVSGQQAEGSRQKEEDRRQRKEKRIANCAFRIADLKTKQEIENLLWERLSAAILRLQRFNESTKRGDTFESQRAVWEIW